MINTVPSFPSPASGDEAGREHGPLDTGRGAPISLCFRADQCSATCHSQTQTRTTTRAPRQASQTPSHLDYRRWLTRSGGRDRRGSRHGGGQQGRPPEHHVSNPHRLGLDQPPAGRDRSPAAAVQAVGQPRRQLPVPAVAGQGRQTGQVAPDRQGTHRPGPGQREHGDQPGQHRSNAGQQRIAVYGQ